MKAKSINILMAAIGLFGGVVAPVFSQWVYVAMEPMLIGAGFKEDFAGALPVLGISCFLLFAVLEACCVALCAPLFKEITDD